MITHRWGDVIDTCSRFSAFFGTAMAGRVSYAAGYTGLGVGATRFGAEVMLDLLAGEDTERTALDMVRKKRLPFPPNPSAGPESASPSGSSPAPTTGRRTQPVASCPGPDGDGLRQLTANAPRNSGEPA